MLCSKFTQICPYFLARVDEAHYTVYLNFIIPDVHSLLYIIDDLHCKEKKENNTTLFKFNKK